MIGLTATRQSLLMDQEKALLQVSPYQFKMIESGIESTSNDYLYGTLDELFSDEYDHMARFVYINSLDSDHYTKITAYAGQKELTLLNDDNNLALLRALTHKHVVVVTKKHLMRGYDYRCESGMVILIAKKMDS